MPSLPLPSEFLIRDAVPEDVPALFALILGLAEYEGLAGEVVATESVLRDTLFGERRYAEASIADLDGCPVGFALFFHSYSTFLGQPGLYLEDLFVESEHRGRGFGGALMRHLSRVALDRGCARLEWTVLDWNERAIGFYQKQGAEPVEEWITYRITGEALKRLASPR